MAHYDTALAHARAAGSGDTEGRALAGRGIALMALGMPDEAKREVHAALEVAERLGDVGLRGRVQRALLILYAYAGPADVANGIAKRVLADAETAGDLALAWGAHHATAVLACFTANASVVALHVAEADRIAKVLHSPLLAAQSAEVALEYGDELWADRAAFLSAFNVEVNANCNGNTNLIVISAVVRGAVANGLQRRAASLPPFIMSCAEGPANVEDRVLTPAEAQVANAQFEQMSDHILAQATLRGYAFMDLEVLFSIPKSPFSVVTFMTSGTPYGPNISLDGLHPTSAGQTLIAQTALQAIEDRYNLWTRCRCAQLVHLTINP